MSPVVARDAAAATQLVYPWPFPLGSAIEISCNADEVAVMCPAWAVGDRLGPGRHNWQSPEPSKPVSVYFVLTAPVQVPFASSSSATTGLIAVCQTTACEPYSRIVHSLSTTW